MAAESVSSKPRASAQSKFGVAGLVFVLMAMVLYHAFWWNRVIGLEAGAGSYVSATWKLQDFLPYRDYFLPTCPLSPLCGAAALAAFGKFYWVTKGLGVLERITIAVLIYLWLRRLFPESKAAFAAVVATIAGSGSFTDPLDAFHQQSEMYTIASGIAASYLLTSKKRSSYVMLSCLAGIFAGLCMCTKQSVGTLTAVVMPIGVTLALLRQRTWKEILLFLLSSGVGYAVVVAVLALWLNHLGILTAFLSQVFVEGPAAKASNPSEYWIRFVYVTSIYFPAFVVSLLLAFPTTRQIFRSAASVDLGDDWKSMALYASLAFCSIAGGIVYAFSHTKELTTLTPGMVATAVYYKVIVLLCLYGLITCAFTHVFKVSRQVQGEKQTQFFIYSFVSCITMLASSLSYPLTNKAFLPALGLVVASSIDKVIKWRLGLICFCWCVLLFGATELKVTIPFGFQNVYEQAAGLSTKTSVQPELRGFLLPEKTVDFIDGTLDVIKQHTVSTDTIFLYPEMAIFYALSGRKFPTHSWCHIIDVTSDKLGAEESDRLIAKRPAVLIYLPDPEELEREEKGWRFGKSSGNRKIVEACEQLAKEYTLARSFKIGFDKTIMVYVRPDKSKPASQSAR